MSSQSFRLHGLVNAATVLVLASVLAWPSAAAAAPRVLAPAELLLNTTFRHAGLKPEPGLVAAARFRVEIPQDGLLALDLTLAGGVEPEPVLRLLDVYLPAVERAVGALRRVAQTPTALLVDAREGGTLLVEVTALEPGQSLPAFKLRSAFQTLDPAEGGAFTHKDVDPWDDDLDGRKPPPHVVTVVGEELCELVEGDDYGDVPLCATPINSAKTVAGVLHNDAGDDEDLFLFRLPATAVVTVEAVSEADLQLVLRDGDGLAVAIARSEGKGAPLRLARALAAGRYFLEVESLNGDDAVYALTLHRTSRP
jgi:hypothetical protein